MTHEKQHDSLVARPNPKYNLASDITDSGLDAKLLAFVNLHYPDDLEREEVIFLQR